MFQLSETDFFKNMHKEEERVHQDQLSLTQKAEFVRQFTNHDPAIERARKWQQQPAIFKKIILDPEWKPITIFVLLIVVFSMLSTLLAAYFACFGPPEPGLILYLDTVMEIFFCIDIVRNFLTQYTDPREPRKPIKDVFKIALHYVKGSFFFDLVAVMAWPLRHAV